MPRVSGLPWDCLTSVTGLACSPGCAEHLRCGLEQGSFPICMMRWPLWSPGSFTVGKGDIRSRQETKTHGGGWGKSVAEVRERFEKSAPFCVDQKSTNSLKPHFNQLLPASLLRNSFPKLLIFICVPVFLSLYPSIHLNLPSPSLPPCLPSVPAPVSRGPRCGLSAEEGMTLVLRSVHLGCDTDHRPDLSGDHVASIRGWK